MFLSQRWHWEDNNNDEDDGGGDDGGDYKSQG
jgi:hypothetical protein